MNFRRKFLGVLLASVLSFDSGCSSLRDYNQAGIGIGVIANTRQDFIGLAAGGINYIERDFAGLSIGGASIVKDEAKGLEVSVFNYAGKAEGNIQIGAFNHLRRDSGFFIQVGVINKSERRILPIINAGFGD